MYPLLDKINSPADIKGLGIEELKQLCSELRQYIIEVCSENPGHLGSSLKGVEIWSLEVKSQNAAEGVFNQLVARLSRGLYHL